MDGHPETFARAGIINTVLLFTKDVFESHFKSCACYNQDRIANCPGTRIPGHLLASLEWMRNSDLCLSQITNMLVNGLLGGLGMTKMSLV
jgi:hypothetical protein